MHSQYNTKILSKTLFRPKRSTDFLKKNKRLLKNGNCYRLFLFLHNIYISIYLELEYIYLEKKGEW